MGGRISIHFMRFYNLETLMKLQFSLPRQIGIRVGDGGTGIAAAVSSVLRLQKARQRFIDKVWPGVKPG